CCRRDVAASHLLHRRAGVGGGHSWNTSAPVANPSRGSRVLNAGYPTMTGDCQHQDRERSRLPAAATCAPGVIDIRHPTGTFALPPSSRIPLQRIARQRHKLAGIGLDGGCGSGCLAITAATIPAVIRMVGLDIVEANIAVARSNAALNGVADKTVFMQ